MLVEKVFIFLSHRTESSAQTDVVSLYLSVIFHDFSRSRVFRSLFMLLTTYSLAGVYQKINNTPKQLHKSTKTFPRSYR